MQLAKTSLILVHLLSITRRRIMVTIPKPENNPESSCHLGLAEGQQKNKKEGTADVSTNCEGEIGVQQAAA